MHAAVRSIVSAAVLVTAGLTPLPAHARAAKAKTANKCQSVVGTWRISSLGLPWTYDVHPDGTATVDGWNQMTWRCAGNAVTFTNGLGANVHLTMSADGNSMSGTMTDGMSASAVRTSAPPPASATVRPSKRGAATGAVKASSRQRYCASKWPAYRDEVQRLWLEEFDIDDEGPLSEAHMEGERRSFMTRCLAGEDPSLTDF
jgi:hypothetical protein